MPITFDQPAPAKQWLSFIPTAEAKRVTRRRRLFPVAGVLIASLGLAAFSLGTNAEAESSVDPVDPESALGAVAGAPERSEAPNSSPAGASLASATRSLDAEKTLASTNAAVPRPTTSARPAPKTTPKPPRRVVEPKPLTKQQRRRATKAARALRDALEGGEVQSSKLMFAAAIDADDDHWSTAIVTCAGLQAGGIGGWRLPSRGELRDLRRAKLLVADAYWTRHANRDEEEAGVAFSARTARTGAWMSSETAAIICVQPRPR